MVQKQGVEQDGAVEECAAKSVPSMDDTLQDDKTSLELIGGNVETDENEKSHGLFLGDKQKHSQVADDLDDKDKVCSLVN